jgi:pyrroline-5-carboxylate reductase
MPESHEPVLLTTARTNFEAKVIVSVLAGAGIQAFNTTGNLMDEFAVTQTFMNLQGVDVLVAQSSVDEANRVLDAAREVGKFIECDEDAAGD